MSLCRRYSVVVTEIIDGNDSPYAPNGIEWWSPKARIGKSGQQIGAERRLAAWLWFNRQVGDTFTMRQLRLALGQGDSPEVAEHLNRRLRQLRKDGWVITSYKDSRELPVDTYRLDAKGEPIWHGQRKAKDAISQSTRRLVFDRDGSRCTVCGVGGGESYPGEPGTKARLTVGHRVPRERGGSDSLDNLRTECARCNEPLRHEVRNPETYNEVFAEVRTLKTSELISLLIWLESGQRERSKVDRAYDRARQLADSERTQMIEAIRAMLGNRR